MTSEESGRAYVKLIADGLTAPMALSKPVACAIENHAIAGGFVLAAACDYVAISRTKDFLVGLTELTVGVPFPRECFECVRHHVVNSRGLRKFVYEGKTMSPLQAFENGFGDTFVIDPVLSASQWLRDRMSLPAGIFALTKRQINASYFQAIGHPDQSLTVTLPMDKQRSAIFHVMSAALTNMQGASRLKSKSNESPAGKSKL